MSESPEGEKSRAGQAALDREALKLSVQGLQRVYAFVVAAAIGVALSKLFLQGEGQSQLPELGRLWSANGLLFISFVMIIVPFFHGMNRHLDDFYALRRAPVQKGGATKPPRAGAIMLDLFVFVLEASLLYVLAFAVLDSTTFFQVVAVLFLVDLVWAFVTWLVTGSAAWKWGVINVGAAPAVFISNGITVLTPEAKLLLLVAIVVVRTIIDYAVNWSFYFPKADP